MASKIKVDQLAGSTASTVTVPTGQTLTVTDGIAPTSLQTVTAAKGGTGQTTFTAGDLLYATSSSAVSKLAKGTAGQILQMNTGATAPSWATPSTGNFVKLSSGTIANNTAKLEFDNIFDKDDNYDRYVMQLNNVHAVSSDTSVRFRFRVYNSDSSTTSDISDDAYCGAWQGCGKCWDGSNFYNYGNDRGKNYGELQGNSYSNSLTGSNRDYLRFGDSTENTSVYWLRAEPDEANHWELTFYNPNNRDKNQVYFSYHFLGRWSGSERQDVDWSMGQEWGHGHLFDSGQTSIRNIKGFVLYPNNTSSNYYFGGGTWVLYGIKR